MQNWRLTYMVEMESKSRAKILMKCSRENTIISQKRTVRSTIYHI